MFSMRVESLVLIARDFGFCQQLSSTARAGLGGEEG